MDVLVRRLIRSAFRRGMADRNWAWLVIAGCIYVLRRTLGNKGGVVSSLRIAPGQQVLISVRDKTTPASGSAPALASAED
jgi:hypothetical protein